MKRGRPRKYELRWTGNIKPNGMKELIWVKIERRQNETNDNDLPAKKQAQCKGNLEGSQQANTPYCNQY